MELSEKIKELKSKGFSILNIKGCKEKFDQTLSGELTQICKDITFRTQSKYLQPSGDNDVIPRKYDYIQIQCGAEKALVKVESADWFVNTDDDGNPYTHTEKINGADVTWTECYIIYNISLII